MPVSDFFFCFFSRNHFLEGGFTFQWGALILSEGHPMGSISFDGGGGGSKKKMGWEGGTLPCPLHYGKPCLLVQVTGSPTNISQFQKPKHQSECDSQV